MTVWEGYIGAKDTTFDQYARSLIHEPLQHFGTDYSQHTRIDTKYE